VEMLAAEPVLKQAEMTSVEFMEHEKNKNPILNEIIDAQWA
jgi:hypothetical protein